MGKVYECIGRYAQNAYTIRNTMIRVWCLEELCYYICENADLLDDSFADPALPDWLEEECALKDLAKQLRTTRRQSIKLENYVYDILDAAAFVDEAERREIGRVIRANRDMPAVERAMVLAEYFLREAHYVRALHIYEELLQEHSGELDRRRLVLIWQNKGVIYARLFYFAEAAEYFWKAYELGGGETARFSYLAAKRMQLNDVEYLQFMAGLPEDFKETAEVEADLEKLRKAYADTAQNRRQEELRKLKATGPAQAYSETALQLLEEEKQQYRQFMAE
ncbi:MAG: hypothetical protein IJ600_08680 [Lachnospiraceae bacterium]|nr:hypothetical protein [Lachnospiraceae bacterium]